MSDVNFAQSKEFFIHGVKKAASAARELGRMKQKNGWLDVARALDILQRQGSKLADSKGLSEVEVLNSVNERQKHLS